MTIGDRKAHCPLDKVNQRLKSVQSSQLWASDFTYVSTHCGKALTLYDGDQW